MHSTPAHPNHLDDTASKPAADGETVFQIQDHEVSRSERPRKILRTMGTVSRYREPPIKKPTHDNPRKTGMGHSDQSPQDPPPHPDAETTPPLEAPRDPPQLPGSPPPLGPAVDADELMNELYQPREAPALPPPEPHQGRKPPSTIPSTRFTIRIPGGATYAEVTGGTANQKEGHLDPNTPKPAPGPIKGFTFERILENLDPVVRERWRTLASEGIFVYSFDGGYHNTIAQEVQAVEDDLKG